MDFLFTAPDGRKVTANHRARCWSLDGIRRDMAKLNIPAWAFIAFPSSFSDDFTVYWYEAR